MTWVALDFFWRNSGPTEVLIAPLLGTTAQVGLSGCLCILDRGIHACTFPPPQVSVCKLKWKAVHRTSPGSDPEGSCVNHLQACIMQCCAPFTSSFPSWAVPTGHVCRDHRLNLDALVQCFSHPVSKHLFILGPWVLFYLGSYFIIYWTALKKRERHIAFYILQYVKHFLVSSIKMYWDRWL